MLKTNANKRLTPRTIIGRTMQYVILITVVTVLFIPIYQTVVSGLKNNGEARSCSYCLPDPIRWENYVTVLFGSAKPGFWTMLLNSMIVLVFTTIAVVLVCSLAAFIFSRTAFRGRDVLFNILMIGLLFPINAAILPIFLTIRSLNLLDTLAGIILPQIAFGMAGTIIILRGFFRAIPSELQDAASIDGCNTFDFFWRVMLPLTRPALAAVAALTAIGSWNSFFLPLLVLSKDTLYTLPLGTMQFQGQYGSDVALTQAFIFLSLIPTVIFYLLAERQIVSGLTSGALKG